MCKVHNKYHNTAPPDAVYVGRGSPFGNPYVIGRDGDRDEVCDKFDRLLANDKELVRMVQRELKGKDLLCFCKPARCHADSLLKIAEGRVIVPK